MCPVRQLEDTCDRPFGNLTFWVYEHGTESETGLRFLSSHVSESVHVCRGTMVDAAAWPLSPAWLSCEFLRRQSGASRSACGCPPAHRVTPGQRQQSGGSRSACRCPAHRVTSDLRQQSGASRSACRYPPAHRVTQGQRNSQDDLDLPAGVLLLTG